MITPSMAQRGSYIGRELGNYTVESVIGHGGMGVIYAGRHRFLGDRVALKVLHGAFTSEPAIAKRFFREAKAARSIDHPNVVKVIDFGQQESGDLFLVMELLEGRSLTKKLAEVNRLDEP